MIIGHGVLRAHLFENEPMGYARAIYWGLYVSELQSIGAQGDGVESINFDWLTFPARRAGQLANLSLDDCLQPNLVECTMYHDGEHHFAEAERLAFKAGAAGGEQLIARIAMHPLTTVRPATPTPFEIECPVRFEGLIVVPQSFDPPLRSPDDAARIAAPYIDLEEFDPPVWDRFRYLFKPKPPSHLRY